MKKRKPSNKKCCEDYCPNKSAPGRKKCWKHISRERRAKDPMRASYEALRYNSRRRKRPFDISYEYFKKFCYETAYIAGKGKTSVSFSIDCEIAELGYVEGNLKVRTLGFNSHKARKKLIYDWEHPDHCYVVIDKVDDDPDNPFLMSRVITFSRFFPAKHPRAGEPTFFVEKTLRNFWIEPKWISEDVKQVVQEYASKMGLIANPNHFAPKYHTIRSGNRWKVGDMFSPRVWSGKPYASKQIQFAPEIEIKKVWSFYLSEDSAGIMEPGVGIQMKVDPRVATLVDMARNDGLEVTDFINWFKIGLTKTKKVFSGQIICWNDSIQY